VRSERSISAIVVTFHTGPILNACLDALLACKACSQIIVVNNGNPLEVEQHLNAQASAEPRLLVLTGHGNIGFGRGCNLGTQVAMGALLAFVNPDCVVEPDTVNRLGDVVYSEDPQRQFVLAGGDLRDGLGHEQRGARRGPLTLWSALVSFSGLGRAGEHAGPWRDFNRNREPMPTNPCDMPVVSGALMVTSASAFTRIGGFDPRFFLHVEDIDLCHRYWEAGGKVVFVPDARATHQGATSHVSSWFVERAKINSFNHFFWKRANTFWSRLSVLAVIPWLALAIILRMLLKNSRNIFN
jgi:N-acetylglucosaminyl-diphospho-decaprenol L-rhamnosyltransferase